MFLFIYFLFIFWGGGRIGCCHWPGTKKEREGNQPHKKKGIREVVGVWGVGKSRLTTRATGSKKQTDQPKVQGKMNFSVRVLVRVVGVIFRKTLRSYYLTIEIDYRAENYNFFLQSLL